VIARDSERVADPVHRADRERRHTRGLVLDADDDGAGKAQNGRTVGKSGSGAHEGDDQDQTGTGEESH